MDEAFEKLRVKKQNSVDNLLTWMKQSNIIEDTKEAEEKARKLFEDVKDVHNVQLEKFKQAVTKLAADQRRSVDELTAMLAAQVPRVLEAARAGANAFVDSLKRS